MPQATLQLESNTTLAKVYFYTISIVSIVICFFVLVKAAFNQKSGYTWNWILLLLSIGVGLPLYYLATRKCYRVTPTAKEFLLEELPEKILSQQPMNALVSWWLDDYYPRPISAGQCLHLDFKHCIRIRLNSLKYNDFGKLVEYMEVHYAKKSIINTDCTVNKKPPGFWSGGLFGMGGWVNE
jgi:hypothetical protein